MRGITLVLMAVLAMTSVAAGAITDVTLGYDVKNYAPCDGMKTFTVQATIAGTNDPPEAYIKGGINVLYAFDITYGQVHQVWTAADTMSEWLYNFDGNTPENDCDSHVVFGTPPTGTPPNEVPTCDRLADIPNMTPPPVNEGPVVTLETNDGVPVDDDPISGWGTLSNFDPDPEPPEPPDPEDAYMLLDRFPESNPGDKVDLLQLVVADGECVCVELTLYTSEYDPDTGWYTDITTYEFSGDGTGVDGPALAVKCVLDGDATGDGYVDGLDLIELSTYFGQSGKTWQEGDFTGEGDVDGLDLIELSTYFGQAASWVGGCPCPTGGEGGAPVPEPGTIVMLVLGTLCLVGYRLRK